MSELPVVDFLDPQGEESLHLSDMDALEAQHGRLTAPWSYSGRDLRDPAHRAAFVAEAQERAARMLAEWEAAPAERDGRGGSCVYRPVLVVVRNFGVGIYCSAASCRVRPLP